MQQIIDGFRLSPQQERLWLLRQDHDVYHAYCALRIDGQLSSPDLFHAVEAVCSRHEIYRTTFKRLPQMKLPVQVIGAASLTACLHVDLRNCLPLDQQRLLADTTQELLATPVNLEDGPSVQCILLTLREDTHVLLMRLHALYADTSSLCYFTQELVRCYEDSLSSTITAFEEVSYLQFSEWQHELLDGKEEAGSREQGEGKSNGAISSPALPFERQNFDLTHFSPALEELSITSDIYTRLEAFLSQQQEALPVFLLACWQVLLWQLTKRGDLLVGIAIDGRIYPQLSSIAGLLVKDLPFIGHLGEDLSFEELLAQTSDSQKRLLSQYPYFSWQDLSNIADPSLAPLYPFAFDFREQATVYQVATTSFSLQQCYAYYDAFKVKLVAVHRDNALHIEFHYDAYLFDKQDAQHLASQYAALLESAIEQPRASISELNMLSYAARKQILVELNQTQADYPHKLCLHQIFEQQVAETPDVIAVYDGEKQLTYYELDRWANRVARYLQEAGVQPEILVGLCLSRSLELLVGVLGILKAGGTYVPLDPTLPKRRLASITTGAYLSILLTTSALRDSLPDLERVICLDTIWDTLVHDNQTHPPVSTVSAANLAYVIYTSGSTGQPKGVMISHQGFVHYVDWASKTYEVAAGRGAILHSSLAFDLTVTSVFTPLVVGRSVWIVAEGAGVDSLADALRARPDFSLVKLTPAHLDLLNQSLAPDELVGTTRMFVIGGEALHDASLTPWRLHAPDVRLINEYGPTETVVGSCIYEVPRQGSIQGNVPIGRPIANTQIYLLDQHMQPVPLGIVAEVYIGGVGLGRGYLNQPALTAERFVAHPFSEEPGARLYKTGDLARYRAADGTLEYLGRVDNQIKLRGHRIELAEIEAVLRQHPQVADCAVLLQEEGLPAPQLVGYVVMRTASK